MSRKAAVMAHPIGIHIQACAGGANHISLGRKLLMCEYN